MNSTEQWQRRSNKQVQRVFQVVCLSKKVGGESTKLQLIRPTELLNEFHNMTRNQTGSFSSDSQGNLLLLL